MRLTLSIGSLLLFLGGVAIANVPIITSVSPGSGPIGSLVTISGSNFSPTPSDNIVYFGAVRATVSAATPTTLTVSVPLGASYSPVSVTTGNHIGFSPIPFDVTFPSAGVIDSTAFAQKVSFGVGVFPAAGFHIVDFDGDGKPDVSNSNGGSSTISIFRNVGTPGAITSGSLTDSIELLTGNQPFDFKVGDLDGDGRLDIVTLDRASNSGHSISLYLNTSTSGALSFQPRFDLTTPTNPFAIALNDFDGDGFVDIAIACYGTDSIAVFHNQSSVGNLSFDPPAYIFGCDGLTGIASGDLNGDARPDLVVVNGSCSSVSLFKNGSSQGSITFLPNVDVMVAGIPNTVAIGDMNGDGKLDLLVSNFMNNYVTALLNQCPGGLLTSSSFTTEGHFPVGTVPRTIAIGDLDGDGKPDLLVGNHDSNNASILHNTSGAGNISFSPKLDVPTGSVPLGVDIGDVDGDGRPDWGVAENQDATISLYRNLLGDSFLIEATAGLHGTITPAGSVSVLHGASQQFTFTPDAGYHVHDVHVDTGSVGAAGTYTFSNVLSAHTISATFAIDTFTIAATAVGGGAISPDGPTLVTYGGSQSYTITPNTGYHLDSLFVDGAHVADASTYEFTNVSENHSITAKFAINVYTISASAVGGGAISPIGPTLVNYGGSQSYTITPNTGYHLDSLFVDGSHVANASTYDFTSVSENHSITAKFAINVYTISASAVGGGAISPDGLINVNSDGAQSYTITPDTGYHLDSLFVDGSLVANASTYDFTNVTSDRTIIAKFAIDSYTISSLAVGNGTISPNGSTSVNYGGSQSYTMTPNTGYHLDSLFVDGSHVANASTYDFTSVSENHSITAKFAINVYTISASAVGGGAISPDGLTNVNYDGAQSYTITPNTGYHLDSLFVDGAHVANLSTYDFTSVTANHAITAKFAINVYTISASAVGGGAISPDGLTNVNYDGAQSYTITPNTGYHLDSLFVDGSHISSASTYDFTNVTSNHTITAKFAIDSYTISSSAVGNGTITPNGSTSVNYGGSQSYTITPNTGYHLDSLLVDGTLVANSVTYDFTNVTSNHSIAAVFGYTCLPASIKPDAILSGEKGHAYLQTFTEEGGAGARSFGISGGAIPPGMIFSSGGVLSGVPDSAGVFHFTMEAIDSQGCSTSREYSLSIDLIARFAISESTLTFGDVIVGNTKQDTIVVSNPGSGDLNVRASIEQSAPFTVIPDSTIIPPGGQHVFLVQFVPTVDGPASGVLSMTHNAAGGTANVGLTGTGLAPKFVASSLELDFNYVLLGSTRRDRLIISNAGTSDLDVTSAISDDSEFVVTPGAASIAPGGHATFYVDFTPLSIGYETADVLFTHNGGAPVSIHLSGTGDVLTTVVAMHPQRWAMVSNPVVTDADSVRELFPNGGFEYAFAYDNPGGYSHVHKLANGRGYWEKFSAAGADTMRGLQIINDTIHLQSGWNLIGSMSVSTPVASYSTVPLGILSSRFFGYNAGYDQVDTIHPGTAYWVKTSDDGILILNPSKAIPKVIPYGPVLNLNALRISDAAGNSQNLKFTFDPISAEVSARFELPPPPPEGLLYAKFDNGKSLVGGNETKKKFAIILSTDHYPVAIQWNVLEGTTESAYLKVSGRIVRLTGTGSVSITDGNTKVELSLGQPDDAIPSAYALRQNYPNPFNPSTVIEYDLPEDAHVTLKVYDILGSEVAILLDGNESAGRKSVRFDGSKLSSGVYFYKLGAGVYSETKRFMIIK